MAAVLASLEARVESQLRLAGDPAVEEAGRAVLEALGPALREAAFSIVRQAVEEVDAQLPDRSVEVLLDGDDPVIRIGVASGSPIVDAADLDARVTLRLPQALKDLIEGAADTEGDSINAYIVKSLNRAASSSKVGTRLSGSYDL